MRDLTKEPISVCEWVDAKELTANDYNPNVVLSQEMKLLEFSLLKQGWIQPILVTQDGKIIDGFHRWHLSTNSPKVIAEYGYMVPVVRMELSEPDRMFLTIRINRAKGNHMAFRMHEIVYKLIHTYNIPVNVIQKEIGASKKEIELLAKQDVFEALDIPSHKYTEAWTPAKT